MAKKSLVVFDYRKYDRDLKYLMNGYASLPPSLAKKHIAAAMNRAFSPFKADFRKAAPVRSGRLRDSVGVKTYFDRTTYQFVTKVGFRRGKQKRTKGHHAMLVNYGTKNRVKRTTGQSVGRVQGQNFFAGIMASVRVRARPAIETHLGAALERATNELDKRLKKGIRT